MVTLALALGYLVADCGDAARVAELRADVVAELAAGHGRELATARSKVSTLSGLVDDLAQRAEEDRDLIGGQAATIQALRGELSSVSTVTITIPGQTTQAPGGSVACQLGEIRVGVATCSSGAVTCTTDDLSHRIHVALSDGDAVALVEVQTSAEPDQWVELPAEVEVVQIGDPLRVIRPEVRLGLMAGLEIPAPMPHLMPALSLQWLHPTRDLDLLGVRVGADSTAAMIGADLACYRVGAHLPIIEAIRLCAGAGYATTGQALATITAEVPI
jgi:hypothetical protein